MKGKLLWNGPTALALVSFVALAIVWPWLPDIVPLHWNARGEIDGTGGKVWMLVLGAVPLALSWLFVVIPKIDPKRESYTKHEKAYSAVVLGTTALLVAVTWLSVAVAWGVAVPMAAVVPTMVGALFLVIGNVLPQARFNYTFGIRTPWTLASEESWRRTHRVGGGVFMVLGLVFLGVALLPLPPEPKWIAAVGLMLVLVVGLFVYSYVVFRNEKRTTRP